jgi:hypothetical protein
MEFNLDIPMNGYFIVYKGDKSFFCNQIRNAQRKEGFSEEDAEYTHVEPSVGGQYSIYANLPKVRVADITKTSKGRYVKIVKMNFNMVPFKYVEELREKYALQDRYKVATWCATRCNIPYSIPGVLWFKIKKVLKKNILSSLGDFCSELSGFGIWREYVYTKKCELKEVLPRYFGELYPADFLNKDYFDIVWEGEIC